MSSNWLPLESNPDVLNDYLKRLGVSKPKVVFCDVFGVEPDLLAMVPRPIRSFIMIYPITHSMDAADADIIFKQKADVEDFVAKNNFFYSRQTIPNACGTMALLHAVMNNLDHVGDLEEGSPLYLLSKKGMDKSPLERADIIASHSKMGEQHRLASMSGVTENQPAEADIDLHFTCFVSINDRCVELDGRKPVPVIHGVCSNEEEFVTVAARAIKEKMNCNPNSLRFNIIALCDHQS